MPCADFSMVLFTVQVETVSAYSLGGSWGRAFPSAAGQSFYQILRAFLFSCFGFIVPHVTRSSWAASEHLFLSIYENT